MKELKASELRIGNWFKQSYTDGYYQIGWEEIKDTINGEKRTPIPLTEQWLIDFGLKDYCELTDLVTIELKYNKGYGVNIWIGGQDWIGEKEINHIDYVHQLQNLYFALTEQELTLNK